jgi:hypothetical protein
MGIEKKCTKNILIFKCWLANAALLKSDIVFDKKIKLEDRTLTHTLSIMYSKVKADLTKVLPRTLFWFLLRCF